MDILSKIDLILFETEDLLTEGRKPFFKVNSPEIILKKVMEMKNGDKKQVYNYLNSIRKRSIANDDTELTHRISAVLKILGHDIGKTNKRGVETNSLVAAKEVHKNITKVLGYTPKKASGDYTEAEKKRIAQYVRTRYPNVDNEKLFSTLNSLK